MIRKRNLAALRILSLRGVELFHARSDFINEYGDVPEKYQQPIPCEESSSNPLWS